MSMQLFLNLLHRRGMEKAGRRRDAKVTEKHQCSSSCVTHTYELISVNAKNTMTHPYHRSTAILLFPPIEGVLMRFEVMRL